MTMHIDQQKEQFSFAYIRAVATVAGFGVTSPSVDDDSIDLMIASRSTAGTVKRPRLELQAKCCGDGPLDGGHFSYALKIKNYDDLRDPKVLVPRILVVVRVPNAPSDWIVHSDAETMVRHCGYWASIRDLPPTTNEATVSVRIERANRFSAESLRAMMDRIAAGGLP